MGVLDVPLRLGGRDVRVAGIHAVWTDPARWFSVQMLTVRADGAAARA